MVVCEKWVVTYRELKGQLGLKSAQKTVHNSVGSRVLMIIQDG